LSTGNVKLLRIRNAKNELAQYPFSLENLLRNPSNPDHINFSESIECYNSELSFGCMGSNIWELPNSGPYIYKVHGPIYHQTCYLILQEGHSRQCAQLYVIDSSQDNNIRESNQSKRRCLRHILNEKDRFFRDNHRVTNSL
jgi:hypothetical protein